MRALVQRVSSAEVRVAGEVVGEIERGLLVYVGLGRGDGPQERAWVLDKIFQMRIFENAEGKVSDSVLDIGGEVLFVSQFTLYGSLARGRRPSFDEAMPIAEAERAYEDLVEAARVWSAEERRPRKVAHGRFRAQMRVASTNEGPFTIWIESPKSA